MAKNKIFGAAAEECDKVKSFTDTVVFVSDDLEQYFDAITVCIRILIYGSCRL